MRARVNRCAIVCMVWKPVCPPAWLVGMGWLLGSELVMDWFQQSRGKWLRVYSVLLWITDLQIVYFSAHISPVNKPKTLVSTCQSIRERDPGLDELLFLLSKTITVNTLITWNLKTLVKYVTVMILYVHSMLDRLSQTWTLSRHVLLWFWHSVYAFVGRGGRGWF